MPLSFSSLLPSRYVGPGSLEPSLWGPFSVGPWVSASALSCYSWASTSALWAGWPTARLPTPSSSLRQTVGMARWAWSAWAPGRTARSAGTPTASACEVRPPPTPLTVLPLPAGLLTRCAAPPADVACRCRDGFVGDGTSVCNGKLLDVLATTANFSTFYGVPRGRGAAWQGSSWREPTHNTVPPSPDATGLRQCHPEGS